MTDRYARYERLAFDNPAAGVLRITMRSPLKMGAMDARMHREVSEIWRDVDADDTVNVVIFTGDGKNHWIKQAQPIFDASLALEFIGFAGPEGKEGIDAFLEKRVPSFDQNCPF